MEQRIEKKKFYISEFQQEEDWLEEMQRKGWKFISTTGSRYTFEPCGKEEVVYQLDFKEKDTPDEDYIQLYRDYGWDYVYQFGNWFYFRKKKEEGKPENMSIFSDNNSKIDMCKRVINGQFLKLMPLYLITIGYNILIFCTDILNGHSFFDGFVLGAGMGCMLVCILFFGIYIGQYIRLNRIMKGLRERV